MADRPGSTSALGLWLGGIVAVAAIVFLLTGGDLGGTKSVDGDHDLPPVSSPGPKR
jgi:hypothetical protein